MTDQQRNGAMAACVFGIIVLCAFLAFILNLGA